MRVLSDCPGQIRYFLINLLKQDIIIEKLSVRIYFVYYTEMHWTFDPFTKTGPVRYDKKGGEKGYP